MTNSYERISAICESAINGDEDSRRYLLGLTDRYLGIREMEFIRKYADTNDYSSLAYYTLVVRALKIRLGIKS